MSNTAFTIDFGMAFWGVLIAIPAVILVLSLISIYFGWKYWQLKKAERPSHKDAELREALGDRNGTGSILVAIREAAQKAKDKEAEAKTKTEELEKVTKEKDEALKTANEAKAKAEADLAELLTAIGGLTGHAAPADKAEGLTYLREKGSDLRNLLAQLRQLSPAFDSSCRDLEALGPVHSFLDTVRIVYPVWASNDKHIRDIAHDRDDYKKRLEIAEKQVEDIVDSLGKAQTELTSMRDNSIKIATAGREMVDALTAMVEAGKVGDQKKIAALLAKVEGLTTLATAHKDSNAQVIDLAKTAITTKVQGGNQQGNANRNRGGGANNQPQAPAQANS